MSSPRTPKPAGSCADVRSKALRLRRLLDAAEADNGGAAAKAAARAEAAAAQQLRDQLGDFFEEMLARFERRKAELLATVDRRAAAAAAAAAGTERALLVEAEAAEGDAGTADRDLLRQRLDDAIALRLRLAGPIDASCGVGVDIAEAERRARRLLACLRLDWSGADAASSDADDAEWLLRRRADNPFAVVVDSDAGSSLAVAASAREASSAYSTLPSGLDLSKFLTPSASTDALGNLTPASKVVPSDDISGNADRSNGTQAISSASQSNANSCQLPNAGDAINDRGRGAPSNAGRVSSLGASADVASRDYRLGSAAPPSSQVPTVRESTTQQNYAHHHIPAAPYPAVSSESIEAGNDDEDREYQNFRTVGAPESLTFVHDTFYTVEGGCIRKYRWQDGRCLGKLQVVKSNGDPMNVLPNCIRSCRENDWLLIVDSDSCKVLCVDSDGRVCHDVGPRISAKYSLKEPSQAVSNGSQLFICCPPLGIVIQPLNSDAGRPATQTNEYLRLRRPIRVDWCQATSRLIVMDNKESESPYAVYSFELAGESNSLRMTCSFYVNVDSDVEPDLLCLDDTDRVALTVDSNWVLQFDGEQCFMTSKGETLRALANSSGWKQLADICQVDHGLLAVCDEKTRWVHVFSAE